MQRRLYLVTRDTNLYWVKLGWFVAGLRLFL